MLTGNFGSPQIISNVEEKLRKDLAFPIELNDEFKEIIEKMKQNNSVAIHLRCGDFRFCNFDNGPITYYEDAIAEIKNKIENPCFFIFSDDMNFAKERFSYLENKTFIEANRGENSYKDLFLMSKCKNFISAPNSTFSFWGAWLSENKDKIILTINNFPKYPGQKNWGVDFCRKDSLIGKIYRGGVYYSLLRVVRPNRICGKICRGFYAFDCG